MGERSRLLKLSTVLPKIVEFLNAEAMHRSALT
jgi:hypothetical protein